MPHATVIVDEDNPMVDAEDNDSPVQAQPKWHHYSKLSQGQSSKQSLDRLFLKPLALSYRNFNRAYNERGVKGLDYHDFTRAEAGSSLVSMLLRHYFLDSSFRIRRLRCNIKVLDQDPGHGSAYWVVEKIGASAVSPSADSQDEPCAEDKSSIVMIVAVITNKAFLESLKQHRRFYGLLAVSSEVMGQDGAICFGEKDWMPLQIFTHAATYKKGAFVILGARDRKPVFEFYEFDCKELIGKIVPFGISSKEEYAKQIITLKEEDAINVDVMFRAAVKYSVSHALMEDERFSRAGAGFSGQERLKQKKQTPLKASRPVAQLITVQGESNGNLSIKARPAPLPDASLLSRLGAASVGTLSSQKPDTSLSIEYLQSLRVTPRGMIQGSGGRHLKKERAEEAKLQAKLRGIVVPPTVTPRSK